MMMMIIISVRANIHLEFCPNGERKLFVRPRHGGKIVINYCRAYFLTLLQYAYDDDDDDDDDGGDDDGGGGSGGDGDDDDDDDDVQLASVCQYSVFQQKQNS